MIQGTIIRVAGPVVDVKFTGGKLPALQEALTVTAEGTERTMEVAQHVDETTVRCIMLSASEGLGKGMEVTATGHGLNAPVGEGTLGRMFDPLGRPIDGKGPVDDLPHWPIHRKAPSFAEQKPATEILETGIKVIDLLAPYAKGGKIGLFGGAVLLRGNFHGPLLQHFLRHCGWIYLLLHYKNLQKTSQERSSHPLDCHGFVYFEFCAADLPIKSAFKIFRSFCARPFCRACFFAESTKETEMLL